MIGFMPLTLAAVIWTPLLAMQATNSAKNWKLDKIPEVPAEVRVDRDVAYLPEDRREKADLYFPAKILEGNRLPTVLLMHGGGFNDGDKARGREVQMGLELAKHGYAVMSINYKLWNKEAKAPTWPQSLYDAKTAVRWLRKNADRLKIDPDRIAAIGNSAGGNLAAMLALTVPKDGLDPKEPDGALSSSVRCAVDFYGAVDLPNYHDMKMFLKTREEDPAVYRKASPLAYVRADAPPLLIVHGTKDETVPHSQAETLAAALKKAGADYQLELVPDAPHTFYLISPARDFRPLVFEFLDKHLKPKQK